MDAVVVCELRHREQPCPVVLTLTNEDPEVGLELLVSPLCLSIGLTVVYSGSRQLDPEHSVDFPGELRDELQTPTGDNRAREPVQLPDVLQVQVGGAEGGH